MVLRIREEPILLETEARRWCRKGLYPGNEMELQSLPWEPQFLGTPVSTEDLVQGKECSSRSHSGEMPDECNLLNGFGSQTQGNERDATMNWWEAEEVGQRDGRTGQLGSATDRTDVLEALVQQLMEQNEQLRFQVAESRSRSSGESSRDRVERVQWERVAVDEGRGQRRSGVQRPKNGKGVGGPKEEGQVPMVRTFQPPWTSFAGGEQSSAPSLPMTGPGDQILAATRALQSLTLRETPSVQVVGQPVSKPEERVPMEWTTEQASLTGLPRAVPLTGHAPPSGVPQSHSHKPPQADHLITREDGLGVSGCRSIGNVVTVMINGVPRTGTVAENGDVVINSESPKYFAIQDRVDPISPTLGPPAPSVAEERSRCPTTQEAENPFSAKAMSPFRASEPDRGNEEFVPPPPPPVALGVRGISRSPTGSRYGYPRRHSRSPTAHPPRPRFAQAYQVNASPATPGGTRLPPGPPPDSPDLRQTQGGGCLEGSSGFQECVSGTGSSVKDFIPGERTYWDLPVLTSPSAEANPAMRCNDWIYKVTPLMSDLAPRAHVWWQEVLEQARREYDKWSKAKPLERARILGKPSSSMLQEPFVRIESRGVAMLSKALPSVVYEQALANRNVTCVGLVYLTLRTFQPGGLNERAELLRGLTSLTTFDSAMAGVGGMQKWFRHLERAKSMGISVPDSSLLLDSLDKALTGLLQGNPSMNFRMHSVRMQLQLDTRPQLETVEEFARTVLSELELLSVAIPDNAKRQRVASVGLEGAGKGKTGGKPGGGGKGEQSSAPAADGKPTTAPKKPCTGWVTDKGCRFGKTCTFAHTVDRPGKCWACGGSHQKVDCVAPGGGKYQKPPSSEAGPKGKGKQGASDAGPSGKGKQGSNAKGSSQTAGGLSQEAIKEAAQLLQSMRLAALRPYVKTATELLRRAHRGEPRGLIDGGATSCLRTAEAGEQDLPVVGVKLAFGECQLLVNPQGTLLSKTHVSPILSVRALLSLGYKIEWDSHKCRIWHPSRGDLDLDSSSGCPEISEQEALALIKEYESLVERDVCRSARLHCIMRDLEALSAEDLAGIIVQRDVHADAAMHTLLKKIFPDLDRDLLSQAAVSMQDQDGEPYAWNRRMRRRCEQASGILVHLFSAGCKRVYEGLADRNKVALLTVERPETLLSDSTFRYLLQQASRGRVMGVIGAPPYRTFAWTRYLSASVDQFHRPLRLRGESLGDYGIQDLDCREQAQRRMDDLLILRIMILTVVATAARRVLHHEAPSFVFENPEDPQEDSRKGYPQQSLSPPESGFATLWGLPEWLAVEKFVDLQRVSFHQGALGHCKKRPTTISTNIAPDPTLLDCWVEGQQPDESLKPLPGGQQNWAGWASGLQCAIGNMLWRAFQERGGGVGFKVRSVDAGFLEHLKNNHTPYRRDCKHCVQGGARQRQHRKVLAPQGWTLSVDTTGPFPLGLDEGTVKAKYLVVGVLSVPILSADGSEVDVPADRDPLITVEGFAQALEDREWFVHQGMELEEPLPDPTQRELKETKDLWNEWEKVVNASREDWLREAKAEYLPKVEMVDVLFTEAVESKKQQEVTGAISRMYAKAISDGYDVRRVHTDRGREFNNAALKSFCNKLGLHQTFALAEEHQTNGRAEGAILRLKSKTRAILQASSESNLKEWPLAAKLAAYQLRGVARKRLKLPAEPALPFNTKVQVLQRSWRRGVWESRTTTAFTKCPSASSARGWVVKTEDGLLFTTSKVFPAVDTKIKFEISGDPVDLDAPSTRLKEKTKVRKVVGPTDPYVPKHPADILAKTLLEEGRWEPKDLAALALCLSKTVTSNERMVKPSDGQQESQRSRPAVTFLSGGFTFGGMTGVRSDTKSHWFVTRYLTEYMARHTDEPFAGIGLSLNSDHKMHRDVHNQRGVPNVVLPIVAQGGGLWIQDKPGANVQAGCQGIRETRQLENGTQVQGRTYRYRSHEPLTFHPHVWHESVPSDGPQLLLFGYTARGLHRLERSDVKVLWDAGFTYVPGTKVEYWGFQRSTNTIVRYHPVPRRQMFAPLERDQLPFSRENLGDLRMCLQEFPNQPPVRSFHRWRDGRGRASAQAWTGRSVFKFRLQVPSLASDGGGDPPSQYERCVEQPNAVSPPDVHVKEKKLEDDGVIELAHEGECLLIAHETARTGDGKAVRHLSYPSLRSLRSSPHKPRSKSLEGKGSGVVEYGDNEGDLGSGIGRGRSRSRASGGHGSEQTQTMGLVRSGVRTAQSPAPVSTWGARYAARFRLCSLKSEDHQGEARSINGNGRCSLERASSREPEVKDQAPRMRCDDLVKIPHKGIEVVSSLSEKVTVCEEFPAKCPRVVMYTCLELELRRLATEACRLIADGSDEDEEEPLPFHVPVESRSLQLCPVSQGLAETECTLERVAWSMKGCVEQTAASLAADHHARCRMLEVLSGDGDCWIKEIESGLLNDVRELEGELKTMQGFELKALQHLERVVTCPVLCSVTESVESPSLATVPSQEEDPVSGVNTEQQTSTEDVAPLQSKIISQEQVRREMSKWCIPLQEEYDNLTKDSGTVKPLSDEEFSELLNDSSIALELIPGKGVYVHKSTGKRRARIVCCGNHQSGESHSKTELFASGIGGEGIRMLVRRAALNEEWDIATADVKAAFLQAPVIAGHCGGKPRVIVVKVPQILRASGVCSERYWLVQKAMYGLAVSPKCWVTHRNKVLRDLRIPYKSGVVRCVPMLEDANMWKLQWDAKESTALDCAEPGSGILGLLGLYVDDILTAGPFELLKAVMETLQTAWQLSAPEYLSKPGDTVKFSGFQVERTSSGYLLHQNSYVMDLLDQYDQSIPGKEQAPAVKVYDTSEISSEEERHRVTRKAQTLVGQLLWVSNRTRPDLAFGVSMAGQKIASCPEESLARAEHLIRYLRHAPGMGLQYGRASGQCGKWNQLKYQEVEASIDVFTDASFCADEQCRSFGSIHMYWAGALIAWASSRQTLIASHTAESELYSLAEGHLMGKAMRPTVAALLDLSEAEVDCRLYCDNSAAVQLCALEAGSWRTRHLRLRGAVIRQDVEEGWWQLAHLEGVFMPADLGTKSVGPSRLEDLIRVCDLWAPHLEETEAPPRPQVASLTGGQTGVAKALVALLLVLQMSGVSAIPLSIPTEDGRLLWQSFVMGFGIGIGWWCASRLGAAVNRCFQGPPMSMGPRLPPTASAQSHQAVQTLNESEGHGIELGESGASVPVQSEGVTWDLSPRAEEALLARYLDTYEDLCEAAARAEGASGSRGIDSELRAVPGPVDRLGSPEIRVPTELDRYDAAVDHATHSDGTEQFIELPEVLRAGARAPTVPLPPDLLVQAERGRYVEYVDDMVEVEDESSSEESSIGEWTTDSGMPRGPSTDSRGSGRSRGSTNSLAMASLVASVRSAEGRRAELEESDGSWEFWVCLVLLAVCFSSLGALGACVCMRRGSFGNEVMHHHATGEQENDGAPVPEDGVRLRRRRAEAFQFSPVMKVTVRNEVKESPPRSPVGPPKGLDPDPRGSRERSSDHSVGLPKGLDPNPRGSRERSSDHSVGLPKGLGPNPRGTGERSSDHSVGPPKGLVPNPRGTQEQSSEYPVGSSSGLVSNPRGTPGQLSERPLGSREAPDHMRRVEDPVALTGRVGTSAPALGPKGADSVAEASGSEGKPAVRVAEDGYGFRCRTAPVGIDRLRRPYNLKKDVIMSCPPSEQRTTVYLTKNGDCIHSTLTSRPMQFASAPIVRNVCPYCGPGDRLPNRRKDDVGYFTRSGKCIHLSETCSAIDRTEELEARRLCKCCKWGGP